MVSMFFAGISGSSTADVAAIGQVMLPPMKREVQPANSAALVAAASTIANMIPPSIMAIVYGAVGGVSIVALFVGGVVPGVMVGIGLMIYSYFTFSQTVRERSSFGDVARAGGASVVPLLIPFIIIAGILGGYFTPTEAGMVAVVYTIVVVIPLLVRGTCASFEDFMKAAVLYSLPMMAVAGASALAYVIAYLRAPEAITVLVEAIAGTNPTLIMVLIVVALVIAGDFLDAIPTIVIAMPVIAGLVELGYRSGSHGRRSHCHPGVRPDRLLTVWPCSWRPPSRRCPSRGLWSRRCPSTWCSSWSFRCSSYSQTSCCGCRGCLTLSSTAESRLVLVERLAGGVAKLTLNNPPLNLVTLGMTRQLIEALQELERDEAVRAVVVTGTGDRAFCAGSDVKEFAAVRDRVVEKKLARRTRPSGRFESIQAHRRGHRGPRLRRGDESRWPATSGSRAKARGSRSK